MTKAERIRELTRNDSLFAKLRRDNQQEYIRKRLRAVDQVLSGKSLMAAAKAVGIGVESVSRWADILAEKGMDEGLLVLARPRRLARPQKLSPVRKAYLYEIIRERKPDQFGLDANRWTGEVVAEVLLRLWGVALRDSRIYQILDELGLSYQKAHRDYAEASPEAQAQFMETVKKNNRTKAAWRSH